MLIECPDCKKNISSEAVSCIFCGNVIKPNSSTIHPITAKFASFFGELLAVLILLVALQYLGIINMNGILKHIGLSPVIDCADDAAVKLTLRLFNEQILTEEYSSEMVSLMKARLDLDSIRTMAMDKNAGRCVCRTDLIIKNPYNESESTVPIEYATYKVKEGMLVEGKTLSRLNL